MEAKTGSTTNYNKIGKATFEVAKIIIAKMIIVVVATVVAGETNVIVIGKTYINANKTEIADNAGRVGNADIRRARYSNAGSNGNVAIKKVVCVDARGAGNANDDANLIETSATYEVSSTIGVPMDGASSKTTRSSWSLSSQSQV